MENCKNRPQIAKTPYKGEVMLHGFYLVAALRVRVIFSAIEVNEAKEVLVTQCWSCKLDIVINNSIGIRLN